MRCFRVFIIFTYSPRLQKKGFLYYPYRLVKDCFQPRSWLVENVRFRPRGWSVEHMYLTQKIASDPSRWKNPVGGQGGRGSYLKKLNMQPPTPLGAAPSELPPTHLRHPTPEASSSPPARWSTRWRRPGRSHCLMGFINHPDSIPNPCTHLPLSLTRHRQGASMTMQSVKT